MAIKGDVTLVGEVSAVGLYAQVRPIGIDNKSGIWEMMYEVRIWKDEATSKAKATSTTKGGVRVPCPAVDKFKCAYDPAIDGDPVKFAYAHLKSLSLIANVSDV